MLTKNSARVSFSSTAPQSQQCVQESGTDSSWNTLSPDPPTMVNTSPLSPILTPALTCPPWVQHLWPIHDIPQHAQDLRHLFRAQFSCDR